MNRRRIAQTILIVLVASVLSGFVPDAWRYPVAITLVSLALIAHIVGGGHRHE